MFEDITYVGMDSHKKDIKVAMLLPDIYKPVEWTVANEPKAIRRMVKKILRHAPGEVRSCYEAGPCGYALKRTIESVGPMVCEVIAPSMTPRKSGERIKTDRRDAKKLAELLRANLLTEVHPPTPEEEAVRDLCRCREDARDELMRARHRLGKMLLRHAITYQGKSWTRGHRRWLRQIKWEHAAHQVVFDNYLRAIENIEERKAELTAKLEELSNQQPWAEPVGALRCFRGIDTVTAMSLVAELHDFTRFNSPRGLMSYLGLVPSENSTGDKSRRGPITKAGNNHARRLLVEAAWHARHKPATSAKLRRRREGQPARVITIAERAQLRLHRKYWHLTMGKNKPTNKAVVAVARELVGFIWAALHPMALERAGARG